MLLKPTHQSHSHRSDRSRYRRHRGPLFTIPSVVAIITIALHRTTRVEAQQQQQQQSSYSTIDGYSCFRNLDGTMQSMFDLAEAYPHLASIEDIGDSYMKISGGGSNQNVDSLGFSTEGYDIYAMNITATSSDSFSSGDGTYQSSSATNKGRMLITSGMHAREFAPPELTMRTAEHLLKSYGVDSDITWLLHHTEIHIIFHVNPDGRYIAENYQDLSWRKNGDDHESCSSGWFGVDINRNFDFTWGDLNGSSDDPCEDTYHGVVPESEPETQAVVKYAKELFPESQRKNDPESNMDLALGDDITGMYVDIHSSGGYVYYPWGHEDLKSPDDDALQALGRKISSFNDYKLWAPGSPDFLYPAAGDSSDYAYGVLGVATFGLEVGNDFYEDCDLFEATILPTNRDALVYAAKLAKKPFSLVKGPDIIDLSVNMNNGVMTVIAVASDGQRVIGHSTGEQDVTKVQLYVDVHPDDHGEGAVSFEMTSGDISDVQTSFSLELNLPSSIVSGQHILFAQAMDSDGYLGPVSSLFFDVERVDATKSPTHSPVVSSSLAPSDQVSSCLFCGLLEALTPVPTKAPTTVNPTTPPSLLPTSKQSSNPSMLPSYQYSTSPSSDPTNRPSTNPTNVPSVSISYQPSNSPSSDVPTTTDPTNDLATQLIDSYLKPSSLSTLGPTVSEVASATEPSSSAFCFQTLHYPFLILPLLLSACLLLVHAQ